MYSPNERLSGIDDLTLPINEYLRDVMPDNIEKEPVLLLSDETTKQYQKKEPGDPMQRIKDANNAKYKFIKNLPKRIIKQYANINAFYDPNPSFLNPSYQDKGIVVEDLPVALSSDRREVVEKLVEQRISGNANMKTMNFRA